jgi:hypothetical protein
MLEGDDIRILRPQLSLTIQHVKLEKSVLRPKKSVTLRRPHFHVVNPSATTHTVNKKSGEVSLSSNEMLEGNDIRKLKIATKYQTETSETCVPKHKDVEVLIDFG